MRSWTGGGRVWGSGGLLCRAPRPSTLLGGSAGPRGAPRCCCSPTGCFSLPRAEEAGRWIELCHVADKFPLASSPCASPPRLPSARTRGWLCCVCGFFFVFFSAFFYCLVFFFHPKTSQLSLVSPLGCDILVCSASSAGRSEQGASPGSAHFPSRPTEPPPAPPAHAGADAALVLAAQQPASCRGAAELLPGGKQTRRA